MCPRSAPATKSLGPIRGLVVIICILIISSTLPIIPVIAQETNESSGEINNSPPIAFLTTEIIDFGHDQDGDQLFDYLLIEVPIITNEPGEYELGSKLILSDDYPVIYVYKNFEVGDENVSLTLRFDGEHIFESGVSGQYIAILWLENVSGETIEIFEYKTNEYEYTGFKHVPPPLILTERVKEFGNDTNKNGLFNFLTLRFGVEVTEPGYYLVLGGLFKKMERKDENTENQEDIFYFLITVEWRTMRLPEGFHFIQLNFKGPRIRLSELNGPYFIGLWIERTEDDSLVDEEELTDNIRLKELYSEQLLWPMVGDGDLSGESIYKTREYFAKDFEEPAKIVKFTNENKDYPVDLNDNGRFEYLRISIGVKVNEPGKYIIVGKLMTRYDWLELWAENVSYLRPGEHYILLDFQGIEIRKSELKGFYDILLAVKGENPEGIAVIDRMKYRTLREYDCHDFESEYEDENLIDITEEPRPNAKVDVLGITTKTNVMEVFTTHTRPEITFWYADTKDSGARFKLVFNRLIGYRDYNFNNRYDFGEERFEVILEDNLWVISELSYSVNSIYGNYVEFQLSSELTIRKVEKTLIERPDESLEYKSRQVLENEKDLENVPNIVDYWGRIDFKFLITSNDFTIEEPLAYNINGDTEVKIDINLDIYKPVDIDGISLEQLLFDEAQIYGFKTKEANREQVFQSEHEGNQLDKIVQSQEPPAEMLVFEPRANELKQWIMFIDEEEKEYGFYSWINKINVTYNNGRSELFNINTSYVTDGTILRLYTNYPYNRDVLSIHHDPSIGMIPENRPSQKETTDVLTEILFNPLTFFGACILLVVIIGVILRGQMRSRTYTRPNRVTKQKTQRPPGRQRER